MADICDPDLPHRLRVLMALTSLIEQISKSSGYDFDLEGKVFRGIAEFGDESPDEMVAISETPRADYGLFAGDDEARKEDWVLYIQGTAPIPASGKKHPTDHLYFMADQIQKLLGLVVAVKPHSGSPANSDYYMLPFNGQPTIASMNIGPPVVVPATKATAKSFFYITIRVGLAQIF